MIQQDITKDVSWYIKDKPKAWFKARPYLQYWYVGLEKKGFRRLFTFTIKALAYTYV